MSSGDKTLSENYLQHADHYARIIDEKRNQIQNKPDFVNKTNNENKNLSQKSDIKQDHVDGDKK